jgi:hypothetical protein
VDFDAHRFTVIAIDNCKRDLITFLFRRDRRNGSRESPSIRGRGLENDVRMFEKHIPGHSYDILRMDVLSPNIHQSQEEKMSKKIIIIAMLFLMGLTTLSFSKDMWTPYNFKGSERFKFDVEITEAGAIQKGYYVLELSRGEGDKIKMHVKAKLEDNEFDSSVTGTRETIYQSMMSQMMFNPAAAPMFITLFAPWWSMYFTGHDWEVGSQWNMTQEGEKVSFKVESECSHAGKKGKKGVWKEGDKVRAEFCISTDVALPLHIRFSEEDDKHYELTLKEYSD